MRCTVRMRAERLTSEIRAFTNLIYRRTTSSLLVGMKADNGRFVNSPVNITSIEQTLIQNTSSTPTLQVKVVGQRGTQGFGTEWFAFTSVVPKVTGTVALDIQYQFK